MIKTKPLIINLLISLGVGGLSALLTADSMKIYSCLIQPPLAPPPWLFPIVWTVLFLLMGISSYLIWVSDSALRESVLTVYAIQLAVNFFWPIIFFGLEKYLFAFFWLISLIVLVIVMIVLFYKIKPSAAYLQLPYLAWLLFAAYLNLAIYLLNR